MISELKVKKLQEYAQLPTRANPSDAGYDLYASEDIRIYRNNIGVVKTDIAIQLPVGEGEVGFYGRIAPRSGLATKHGINTIAGVIDSGYRGEIKVGVVNHGTDDYLIKKGDRIAQLIVTPIMTPLVVEVDELDKADRGTDGFGSTGK